MTSRKLEIGLEILPLGTETAGDFTALMLTAHLVPLGHQQPAMLGHLTFRATELLRPEPDEPVSVCGRVLPAIAYFGCISPAITTPRFLKLIQAEASKTVRFHRRDGATFTGIASSRKHETALLAIERSAFSLPEGWRMRWFLEVDGKFRAVLASSVVVFVAILSR